MSKVHDVLVVEHRHAGLGLAVAILAMASIPLAVTGTNLAFPSIEADFDNVSRSVLSWALSGYSIIIAAFTLLGGQLADRFGSHKMFVAGFVVFMVSSLAAAAAPGAGALIAARCLQGAGGALIVPSSLTIALARWPDSRRAVAIGAWTAAFPIGSSIAPVLAAGLLEVGGWRWVFTAPAICAGVALSVAMFLGDAEPSAAERADAAVLPDLVGVVIGTVALGLLALAIVQGPKWGWASRSILVSLIVGCTLLWFFLRRSRRHPRPLISLELFSIPTFRVASIANVFVSVVGMAVWLVWPLMLAQLWNYKGLDIGLAITPTPIIGGTLSILVGRIVGRIGYRRILLAGAILTTFANLWFVTQQTQTPQYWTHMFPGLVLFGFGMGLTFAPLNGAALLDVPRSLFGQANAAFNTGRFLSGALGIAAVVAALGNNQAADPLGPFRRAFFVLSLSSLVSAVVIALAWPKPRAASEIS